MHVSGFSFCMLDEIIVRSNQKSEIQDGVLQKVVDKLGAKFNLRDANPIFRRSMLMGWSTRGITRIIDEIEVNSNGNSPHFDDVYYNGTTDQPARCTWKWKIKMVASKFQIRIYQFVNEIATNFQRFHLCFRDQISNSKSDNVVQPSWKKPEVESPQWRILSFQYVYLNLYIYTQDNNEISTAMPMFCGHSTRLE